MSTDREGLYKELTYRIIGALYEVHNELGSVHKEDIYHKAVASELKLRGLDYVEEPQLPVEYKGKKIGVYKPDFLI
ncbi:MAG: GxxExxY protein [Candidatus Edwardsbacteria bacterium]